MFKLLLIAALAVVAICQGYSPPHNSTNSTTFTNPIINEGADPWMFRHGDYYYLTYSNNVNVTLFRSKSLTDWDGAESKLVFAPPPGMNYSTDLWAPEIHNLDDNWYVIFTADPRNDSPPPEIEMWCDYNCPAVHHRMFVVEGKGSDPWEAEWEYKAELDTYDQFAIDGTYFQHADQLYHIYSCWHRKYDGWPANLCITKMEKPWMVSSPFSERQIISVPEYAWEKTPFGRASNDRLSSNEGPQQLTNPTTGQQFLIYSAARSDNRNYCLAQLELVGDNPMNPGDWRKHPYPVFYQNPSESAYGVGHASFTTSPDDSEAWIVYHGMRDPTNGWGARTIRAQKFGWNEDGTPNFPKPGYGPYEVPSGQ
ncbi:glycoside hydrolase family 43 protein [Cucurbitaria berberidis CBS 394.84]|uniref:Glycoside hydrolase family 43 protein n=1 Tax=Cucurbitaria berberidis CBS 394.84 TaxID=1168544 RepID=A0A9P4GMW6_9PLEO|nr:glycoside hydrolase family 43 protein [Cucurbitaria berberidis CBS 394.84]KAF1848369.1 glycoside hydrolase family 43 protein [Cucurbitaria berberidis CBS 394.84]